MTFYPLSLFQVGIGRYHTFPCQLLSPFYSYKVRYFFRQTTLDKHRGISVLCILGKLEEKCIENGRGNEEAVTNLLKDG